MEINDLKRMFIDLIMSNESRSLHEKKVEIFNSNFNYINIFYELEPANYDVTLLWADPSIDNPAIDFFFNEAIKYYKPENCLLSKSQEVESMVDNKALNNEELFDLFKKIFVPIPPLSENLHNELINKFNSHFAISNFYEILFEEFNWDEIVEGPNMYDEEINDRIKQELLRKGSW